MACGLPTCAQGSSAAATEFVETSAFCGILGAPGALCAYGEVLVLLVYTLMCTGLVLRRCAYRWTRPLGGGRWRYCLRGLLGVHWFPLKMRLEDWRKWWPLRSCEAACAGLGEIAQSPWSPSMHGKLDQRSTPGRLHAKVK